MKLSKQILTLINESSSNEEVICAGLKAVFYRAYTELVRGEKHKLASMNTSFAKKEDRKIFVELAKKHFNGFDLSGTDDEYKANYENINNAYKAFKKEIDTTLTSELEKYGLGKAPFRFLGAMESPSKDLQEKNPEAYNNALSNFPRFDAGGIGSCARCYNLISIHYIIKSSDGKIFPLGSECVGRLHDKKAEEEAKKAELKINKEKTDKRNNAKKGDLDSILNDSENIEKLKAMPKPKHKDYDSWDAGKKAWWDGKMGTETVYDDVINKNKMSGTAGKIRLLKEVKKLLDIK